MEFPDFRQTEHTQKPEDAQESSAPKKTEHMRHAKAEVACRVVVQETWAVNSNLELCLFPFPVIFPSPHTARFRAIFPFPQGKRFSLNAFSSN